MEKISTEKQAEILDAAMKLFSERGFERTTVDEIATRANVGKGTIYLYFENKEQIFCAVLETGLLQINHLISENLAAKTDFLTRLGQVIHTYLKFIEDHHDFYRIFLKERLNLNITKDSCSHDRLISIHEQMNRVFTDFFDSGIETGYLRPGDPHHFSIALSGIVSHFSFHWLMEGSNTSLCQLSPVILDLFLNGVRK